MPYPPAHYLETDPGFTSRIMRDHPFAALITPDLHATHLPLLHKDGMLAGHLARGSPAIEHLDGKEALAIFNGPHAYVSADWYPDPSRSVPTWNFIAVHVRGRLNRLSDDVIIAHLQDMAAALEGEGGWSVNQAEDYVARIKGGIVAFDMQIGSIQAFRKLSREKSPAIQKRVIDALELAGETATAQEMRLTR